MGDIDNTPWCTCGECSCGDRVQAENEALHAKLAIAIEALEQLDDGEYGFIAADALKKISQVASGGGDEC